MEPILLKPLFWTMLLPELLENKCMELSHPVFSFCYAQMRRLTGFLSFPQKYQVNPHFMVLH